MGPSCEEVVAFTFDNLERTPPIRKDLFLQPVGALVNVVVRVLPLRPALGSLGYLAEIPARLPTRLPKWAHLVLLQLRCIVPGHYGPLRFL